MKETKLNVKTKIWMQIWTWVDVIRCNVNVTEITKFMKMSHKKYVERRKNKMLKDYRTSHFQIWINYTTQNKILEFCIVVLWKVGVNFFFITHCY